MVLQSIPMAMIVGKKGLYSNLFEQIFRTEQNISGNDNSVPVGIGKGHPIHLL